jgi:hypothetical protein
MESNKAFTNSIETRSQITTGHKLTQMAARTELSTMLDTFEFSKISNIASNRSSKEILNSINDSSVSVLIIMYISAVCLLYLSYRRSRVQYCFSSLQYFEKRAVAFYRIYTYNFLVLELYKN